MKKNLRTLFFSILIFSNFSIAQTESKRFEPAYRYQISIESGLGDASAPGTAFPFGGSGSAAFRFQNHVIGLRTSSFSDLNIFGSSDYYAFLSPIYGFAFQKKYTSIVPQVGIGLFRSNHSSNHEVSALGLKFPHL